MNILTYQKILAELIAFDTTSERSNLALIEHIEAYLRPFSSRIERIEDEGKQKASLWITFGPQDKLGYVLSGHSDTVPVAGQDWSANPYHLRVANGRLYGRGACDMKGFLAVCLAHAPQMAKAALKLPIHIAISYDEEVGCVGVRPLLAIIASRSPKPLGCFVGEPTNMQVVIGHKGKRAFRTIIKGQAGHSSLAPHYANAIESGAAIVEKIRDQAQQLQNFGARDPLYDVGHSTLLTTLIEGGQSLNIVPETCILHWECRCIAQDYAMGHEEAILSFGKDVVQSEMRRLSPEAYVEFEEVISYPGLDTAEGSDLVSLAHALTGTNSVAKVAFGTEAGLFAALAGIPAVVVGPGSVAQAHKADEYIEIEQLVTCGQFIEKLIAHCS